MDLDLKENKNLCILGLTQILLKLCRSSVLLFKVRQNQGSRQRGVRGTPLFAEKKSIFNLFLILMIHFFFLSDPNQSEKVSFFIAVRG